MNANHAEEEKAPGQAGPYSAAVWAGNLLFLSGQVPLGPGTGKLVEGGFAAQAERVFDNLEAVLAGEGLGMPDVVKTTVYLASAENFREMNGIYGSRFKAPFPARTTVAGVDLPLGALIEVEAVAVKP